MEFQPIRAKVKSNFHRICAPVGPQVPVSQE
jgi:hypothetical protein